MAENPRSVPGGQGMRVAPSPLNTVKLELAVILVVGFLLLLAQGKLLDSLLAQLLVLSSYSLAGMVWIVVRTRAILWRIVRERESHPDGPHQK
ncbi:MAG: hypothetical protein WAT67_06315 [Candidatus Contendobacter sp.]